MGPDLPFCQHAGNHDDDGLPHPLVGVSMKVLTWFERLAISLAYLIVWHHWPSREEREQGWKDWYE